MQEGTIVEKFTRLDPTQFGQELRKLQDAESTIGEAVTQQVESQNLTPRQGLEVAAHNAVAIYGYQQISQFDWSKSQAPSGQRQPQKV